jgi:hypothetical protein
LLKKKHKYFRGTCSQDHNTSNPRERERVTAMGGVIKDNRVGGVLMPTRSAGALRAPFYERIKRKELKGMTAMGGVIKDNRVGGVLMSTRLADALCAPLLRKN